MKGPEFTSNRGDWCTPWGLIKACEELVGPFDLDACAKDGSCAKAPRYYTPEENGLTRVWYGRTWVNPPYGRGVAKWIERARHMARNGARVVMLLPARTDTVWFHDLVIPHAEVRLIRGRVKFEVDGKPGYPAPFPSMLALFGRMHPAGVISPMVLPTSADYLAEDALARLATKEEAEWKGMRR